MKLRGIVSQAIVALLIKCLPTESFQSTIGRLFPESSLKMSGYGIAEDYTWKEEAFEIEITVQLPPGVTGKDVHFKPGLTSVDLRVNKLDGTQVVLLDGNRKMRGRISLDGTFWVFSDRRRSITLTLEKYFPHSNDDMRVLDYDWKGIYPNDDAEVEQTNYDDPEVLNVREYAASLGVDVDNINRSMVDETMFSSGLNLTQRALDQLTEQGYVTEVTKQNDGTEFKTNPETGEAEPFAFDTDDGSTSKTDRKQINIPFIDTYSPWHQAVPVSVDRETNKTTIVDTEKLKESLNRNAKAKTRRTSSDESTKKVDEGSEAEEEPSGTDLSKPSDPIERLTVRKLKSILREQGLKVSGSKSELQERIRGHVNSLLNEPAKDNEES